MLNNPLVKYSGVANDAGVITWPNDFAVDTYDVPPVALMIFNGGANPASVSDADGNQFFQIPSMGTHTVIAEPGTNIFGDLSLVRVFPMYRGNF